jgi:hypothetical protein
MLELEGATVFCAKTDADIKALAMTVKQVRLKTITMYDVIEFLEAN